MRLRLAGGEGDSRADLTTELIAEAREFRNAFNGKRGEKYLRLDRDRRATASVAVDGTFANHHCVRDQLGRLVGSEHLVEQSDRERARSAAVMLPLRRGCGVAARRRTREIRHCGFHRIL